MGGGGVGGGEGGDEHVAAGEELFVGEGGFVVVVDEAALGDVDVEEAGDRGGSEDALGGPADLAGVDELAVTHPPLQREQFGFGAGDELGGAHRVAVPAFDAGDDDGATSVGEGDVAGGGVCLGHRHPGAPVVATRRRGLRRRSGRDAAGWPARDRTRGPTTFTLSAEIRPRSATTQIRPTPKRVCRSSNTPGRVDTSAVLPANT